MIKFFVTDRETIENGFVVDEPYVVISIRSPGVPEPRVSQPAHCHGVYYEVFHDALPSELPILPEGTTLMTAEQAKNIAEFFDRHRHHIKFFVVHCEAGWSRSPAIAAALAKYCDQEFEFFYDHFDPNDWVYELMCEALANTSSTAPMELFAGYESSKQAFRRC